MFTAFVKVENDLPVNIILDLFDKHVKCGGSKKIAILEKLHLKFLKYTLKVKMTTCSNMVYVAVKNRIIK